MLKIIKNPNQKEFEEILKDVETNDGYCPCFVERTADRKCMCKNFREQQTEGFCHCGLYKKAAFIPCLFAYSIASLSFLFWKSNSFLYPSS